ncbi:YopX family protein [Bacillus sp. SIMBA_074]|uniref:YopX family protein n=1 Tax=Bacillus sp. SIMBA_074 TaxID=3085812 RepID=UPI00397D8386
MREIKFRGMPIEDYGDTKWFYGNAIVNYDDKLAYIEASGQGFTPVKWGTVSQYTGLKDSKGNEIYEGDIVHVWEQDSFIPNRDSGGGIIDYDCVDGFSQLGVVSFKGSWYTHETKQHLEGREEQIYAPLDFTNDLFVAGNIHENADLLNGGKNK